MHHGVDAQERLRTRDEVVIVELRHVVDEATADKAVAARGDATAVIEDVGHSDHLTTKKLFNRLEPVL